MTLPTFFSPWHRQKFSPPIVSASHDSHNNHWWGTEVSLPLRFKYSPPHSNFYFKFNNFIKTITTNQLKPKARQNTEESDGVGVREEEVEAQKQNNNNNNNNNKEKKRIFILKQKRELCRWKYLHLTCLTVGLCLPFSAKNWSPFLSPVFHLKVPVI